MCSNNPLTKTKEEYNEVIEKISSESSAVGIDAQYTHAIIIEYLKDLTTRLKRVEQILEHKQ